MRKPYAFLTPRRRQHIKRQDGQQHPNPLIEVEPFAENDQCAEQRQYRLCGLNRASDGQRKMLDREISGHP